MEPYGGVPRLVAQGTKICVEPYGAVPRPVARGAKVRVEPYGGVRSENPTEPFPGRLDLIPPWTMVRERPG